MSGDGAFPALRGRGGRTPGGDVTPAVVLAEDGEHVRQVARELDRGHGGRTPGGDVTPAVVLAEDGEHVRQVARELDRGHGGRSRLHADRRVRVATPGAGVALVRDAPFHRLFGFCVLGALGLAAGLLVIWFIVT
ncbi:hypothetical protein [Streptomyces sp. NPDC056304]|uniref:hypothetical protein n=1 Tax=Streptomyces sp. NPDC056304 TaxID=3345778 RepID=UPI0035DD575D